LIETNQQHGPKDSIVIAFKAMLINPAFKKIPQQDGIIHRAMALPASTSSKPISVMRSLFGLVPVVSRSKIAKLQSAKDIICFHAIKSEEFTCLVMKIALAMTQNLSLYMFHLFERPPEMLATTINLKYKQASQAV